MRGEREREREPERSDLTKKMVKMELSLSRSRESSSNGISKQSPLREALTTDIVVDGEDYLPSGVPQPPQPSPTMANDVKPHAVISNNTVDIDDAFTTTTSKSHQPTLCRELFTYYINRTRTKKIISILIILSIVPVLIDFILYNSQHVSSITQSFLDWMKEYGDLAVFIYVIVMSVLTLFFVPPSIFVFASGFIFQETYGRWGIIVAWISSFLGALIGGSLGFWRARYLSRDLVQILMRRYPLLRAVDAAIVKNQLKVMFLMRLNLLIPFGVLNYIFGISGVHLSVFLLSMPAVLPWYLLLVCLGGVSHSMYSKDGTVEDNLFGIMLISSGVASGIIALVITWKFAKKELQKEAEFNQRWKVDKTTFPEVSSRTPDKSKTSSMLETSSTESTEDLEEDIPPRSSNDDTSSRIDEMVYAKKNNDIDEYNDNGIEIVGIATNSDCSNLGEKLKRVVQKFTLKSKSSKEELEETDIGLCDVYFRCQEIGEDEYYGENPWLIILDEFS